MSIITDNTVLVHIYSGLESKNKVTLGLLVALNAEKNDHKVTLFLAGDGVQILNCKKAGEIVGQGTGDIYDHLQNLKKLKLKNKGKDVFVYSGKDLLAKVKGAKGLLSKEDKFLV